MKYSTLNIGDEIQSIAAKRFLPNIDCYVDREQLDSFHPSSESIFKLILNGWYMHLPEHFPPSRFIDPLLISMHFTEGIRSYLIKNKANIEYLREHGPVGCRDKDTMLFMLENDILAYFSGCITLTLTENKVLKNARKEDYVLCVDVPDEVLKYVKAKSDKTVYSLTKVVAPYVESLDKLELAKVYLYVYHNASAVVTANLHTALPCLGFNTPVCLLEQEEEDSRFMGLDELVNHYKCSEFTGGAYDINNPPANPQKFAVLRDSLVETCRNFTGYDSKMPTLEDYYIPDFMRTFQMLQTTPQGLNRAVNRAVWGTRGKKLLKIAAVKACHKFFPIFHTSKFTDKY